MSLQYSCWFYDNIADLQTDLGLVLLLKKYSILATFCIFCIELDNNNLSITVYQITTPHLICLD